MSEEPASLLERSEISHWFKGKGFQAKDNDEVSVKKIRYYQSLCRDQMSFDFEIYSGNDENVKCGICAQGKNRENFVETLSMPSAANEFVYFRNHKCTLNQWGGFVRHVFHRECLIAQYFDAICQGSGCSMQLGNYTIKPMHITRKKILKVFNVIEMDSKVILKPKTQDSKHCMVCKSFGLSDEKSTNTTLEYYMHLGFREKGVESAKAAISVLTSGSGGPFEHGGTILLRNSFNKDDEEFLLAHAVPGTMVDFDGYRASDLRIVDCNENSNQKFFTQLDGDESGYAVIPAKYIQKYGLFHFYGHPSLSRSMGRCTLPETNVVYSDQTIYGSSGTKRLKVRHQPIDHPLAGSLEMINEYLIKMRKKLEKLRDLENNKSSEEKDMSFFGEPQPPYSGFFEGLEKHEGHLKSIKENVFGIEGSIEFEVSTVFEAFQELIKLPNDFFVKCELRPHSMGWSSNADTTKFLLMANETEELLNLFTKAQKQLKQLLIDEAVFPIESFDTRAMRANLNDYTNWPFVENITRNDSFITNGVYNCKIIPMKCILEFGYKGVWDICKSLGTLPIALPLQNCKVECSNHLICTDSTCQIQHDPILTEEKIKQMNNAHKLSQALLSSMDSKLQYPERNVVAYELVQEKNWKIEDFSPPACDCCHCFVTPSAQVDLIHELLGRSSSPARMEFSFPPQVVEGKDNGE